MKCRFCGTLLPDRAKFCPGCGREIESDMESREASNIPEDAYYRTISEDKSEKTGEKIYEGYRDHKKNDHKNSKSEESLRKNKEQKSQDNRIFKNGDSKRKSRKARTDKKLKGRERINNKNTTDNTKVVWSDINNTKSIRDDRNNTKIVQRDMNDIKSIRNDINNTKSIQDDINNTNKKNSNRKRKYKKISARFIIAYLVIVLTGGFCLYKMGFPEKVMEMISKKSFVSDSTKDISKENIRKDGKEKKATDTVGKNGKDQKTAGKATTEEKKEKDLEATESTLAYTDNSSMNVGACLSPEDYNTVTAGDGSFHFAYPKYLFDHSEVDASGTSYKFSYKGRADSKEAELVVYTQDDEGDPLQNARELYESFSSGVYKRYFKMYPSRVDGSGMARTLIGASTDSEEKTGVYIIAANDGKKDYILKFTYPDPDMTDDYNEIDYVVDCIYRFCSFSGGTYQPRSYQQFLNDDMGSKK